MRLIVAISGASGAIYGVRILEELKKQGVESHLVISRWGEVTIPRETDYSFQEVKDKADFYYCNDNLGAVIASGSTKFEGMIIAPCSMKTLASIASGYSEDLIARAADVTLKEGRKLLLMVRETPLSPIHLENMLKLSRIGVVIMPPVPTFYTNPSSLEEVVDQTVGRALAQFDIEVTGFRSWPGI